MGGRGLRFRVWDLCGSVRGVWLVGLLGVLFQSWDASCLEGGDVAGAVEVVVVEAVVVAVAVVDVVVALVEAEKVEVSGQVDHFVIEVAVVVRIMAVEDHSRALEK